MRFRTPLFIVSLLCITAVIAAGLYLPTAQKEKNKVLVSVVYDYLNNAHFRPRELNDEFSQIVFKEYIEDLDFGKRFLLKGDIDKLKKFEKKIDDQIKAGEIDLFEASTEVVLQRRQEARTYVKDILSVPFELEKKESYESDAEKREFAKTTTELKDEWRKYLKSRVVGRVYDQLEEQQKRQEDQDSTLVIKTLAEIEEESRKKELELHEEWFSELEEMREDDWIAIYLNAITGYYDPHTEYFPPEQKEAFEVEMTGQFEGIGAQLLQKGEFITIDKVISGSASWRQGELEVGDAILKVAQGDEEPVDVVGMPVRKAVKLIRGKKGSEVRLTVRKLDGTKKVVPIIRDIVELEATFVKSAIIEEDGKKIGYIRLPKFYVDFYDDTNRNCAEDTRKELEKLKKENVDGVILDLRNNGGGSLQAVVDIVGLFIDEGPVVQVKSSVEETKILSDRDGKVTYEGPLVVMVNEFSASASEIFAAAIQDYDRGVVVGSKTTFGKGTVQNILSLDRAVRNPSLKPMGALKLTIQKYYRIDGGTTQLKGVIPELILPDAYMDIEYGEKDQRHPLEYDEIAPAKFDKADKWAAKYNKAIGQIKTELASYTLLDSIRMHASFMAEIREETEIDLDLSSYTLMQKERDIKSKAFRNMYKMKQPFPVGFIAADLEEVTADPDKKKELEQWHKNLAKDVYLYWAKELVQAI